jgi:hypothetical protein
LYVRPEDCPIDRWTESGRFDILSNGYAVLPPSLHRLQRRYEWLGMPPGEALRTAAPRWVVESLLGRVARHTRPTAPRSDDPGAPPVRLRGDALERWHGRLYDINPETGELDRSYSLWSLAVALLEVDCTPAFVEELLAQRDTALGWDKFTERNDAIERYSVIVGRALASVGPRVHVNGTARVTSPAPAREFIITNLSTVEPERVEWLWQHRVPLGKLTLLDGDPDLGKSLLTLDLAARLSRGHVMPDGSQSFKGVAGTVLLSAEDGIADTIRPRLEQAGGDPTRIVALEGIVARKGSLPAMPSLEDLDAIEAAVRMVDAKLIVVDPIMAYLPSGVSAFKDQEVRRLLGPLVQLINRLGVALICVRHLNKDTNKPSLYRGGGTIGFSGAARSVMLVGQDPGDETHKRRILARQKGNLAPPWRSLVYEMVAEFGADQPHIRWAKETSDLKADDLLRAPKTPETPEAASQLAEAVDFLQQTLADGVRPATQVMAEATKLSISKSTLNRAKTLAGVRSLREVVGDEAHWYWSLAKGVTVENLGNHGNVENLGDLENLGGEDGDDEG